MKLTPLERRTRIFELIDTDDTCKKLFIEQEQAKKQFIKLTDGLPRPLRDLLWRFPGAGYFLHHRILTLICENMKFKDEE